MRSRARRQYRARKRAERFWNRMGGIRKFIRLIIAAEQAEHEKPQENSSRNGP